MLWLGSFISIWKIQAFQSWIKSSISCLWQGEGCTTSLSPSTMKICHQVRWEEELLNLGLFSWKIYFCLCHLTQILKIPNKLESLSAGLHSSFNQSELWSVLHTRLPWAPPCGAGNGCVHKTCPSYVTEGRKAAQIISVRVVFVIFEDELCLTKKWAVKCVLQSYCLAAAFMPAHKIGKHWKPGGPYLYGQVV